MTETTMLAVVAELNKRGVPATYEYPGFISVAVWQGYIAYGDANGEEFAGQVCSPDGEFLEALDGIPAPNDIAIPLSPAQISEIADHISCDFAASEDVKEVE